MLRMDAAAIGRSVHAQAVSICIAASMEPQVSIPIITTSMVPCFATDISLAMPSDMTRGVCL